MKSDFRINPAISKQALPKDSQNRSVYRWKWQNTLTARFGDLIPISIDEVLPHEDWSGSAYPFIRFLPLVAPVMHDINVFVHYFFVPCRLLYSGWEDFIGGITEDVQTISDTPQRLVIPSERDSVYGIPYFDLAEAQNLANVAAPSTLADYLGLNIQASNQYHPSQGYHDYVSLMPFLAYHKIWNDFYRDKDLQPEVNIDNYQGEVEWGGVSDLFTIHSRNYEPDYFTSAKIDSQRGAAMTIPFSSSIDDLPLDFYPRNSQIIKDEDGNPIDATLRTVYLSSNNNSGSLRSNSLNFDSSNAVTEVDFSNESIERDYFLNNYSTLNSTKTFLDLNGSHTADASGITNASTIEDLRVARLMQRFLEISEQTENDYQSQIESFFNVRIPDYRLKKSEFIGGGRQAVTISEVTQTSQTDTTALGTQGGHAISVPSNCYFKYHSYEHGFIIGIMSIMPRTSYSQGLRKMWKRFDKFDFPFPQFANLGPEEVKNSEIYHQGQPTDDNAFGYQPRYLDTKVRMSEYHGLMKTDFSYWTMGRKFSSAPSLSAQFIRCDSANHTNIFADTTDKDNMLCQINFNVKKVSPIPMFNTPII